MSKTLITLRTAGFRPLRRGRIHMRCPLCGRKQSNVRRERYDPEGAVLAEIPCPKHDGLKDPTTDYFDALGEPIYQEPKP